MNTNINTTSSFSTSARRALFTLAIFLLILSSGSYRQAHAVPFQETDEDIQNRHYNMCKNKLGPQLTKDQADKLDANCQEIVKKPLSPKEIEFEKIKNNMNYVNPDFQTPP